ncbi:MAG: chemotaxis protein CheD [Rubrivivax sp.]
MNIVVNVSDARHSSAQEDVIITYSLGSCIGLTMYDPVKKIGGMLHFQLPTSTMDASRAAQNPCMFADTGVAKLLADLEAKGADRRRLKVKIAGDGTNPCRRSEFQHRQAEPCGRPKGAVAVRLIH